MNKEHVTSAMTTGLQAAAHTHTHTHTLRRTTCLLVQSFFDKLGDLFPGAQWDSHLLQVLNSAHELRERDNINSITIFLGLREV